MTHEEKLALVYSIDDFDYSTMESKYSAKECRLCHKQFVPLGRNGSRQNYCKRSHFINCVVCSKPILLDPPSDKPGSMRCTCSAECTSKFKVLQAKQTVLDKYGCENISQVPEFKEKISASIRAKAPETAEKVKATLIERYGGMGTGSPTLRAKIEATMQAKYGVTNPDESIEFRNKISAKLKSSEAIEKRKQASRAKYGTDLPAQSAIVQDAMRQMLEKHWGVPFSGQIPEVHEKAAETSLKRYGMIHCMNTPAAREKASRTMLANRTGRASHINQRFAEFLKSHNIEYTEEKFVAGKWFDFCVRDNVLIEINPSYTHSLIPSHWDDSGKTEDYHLKRTELANENGYRCIHVFDWDNWEDIIDLVKQTHRLYARNCSITELDTAEAHDFINKNHIQHDAKGAKYSFGLFYASELVEVMTFSKARYNKNYDWELLRLCTKRGYSVVGGASRLFSRFTQTVNPQSVVSYCDRAKFSGSVYKQIGMTLHHTSSPAKVWSKGDKYVTDNLLRQRGFDQLFNASFGKGTSNEQLMIAHGWLPVCDCGQFVFEWKQTN